MAPPPVCFDDIDDIYDGSSDAPGSQAQSGPDLALVQQVKTLCRVDPKAKVMWCTWCDANTQGTLDPMRLDAAMLNRFFEEYHSGQIPYNPATPSVGHQSRSRLMASAAASSAVAPPRPAAAQSVAPPPASRVPQPAPQQGELAEVVRIGQRVSQAWKVAWVTFCDSQGARNYDPARHEKEFLLAYIEFVGSTGAAALQGPGGGGGVGPDAKRQRTDGDGAQEGLAHCVLELQKRDSVAKQLWADFCDAHGKDTYDPAFHDELSLRAFFQYAGLPQPDAPAV